MAHTMLIADDLTGALDAGVCLLPSKTLVVTEPEWLEPADLSGSVEALCVNSGTRHLDAESAAAQVAELVTAARAAGVDTIVKKTDSALRGNVGAELAAAWRASGAKRLHFIPALPSMGRVTKGGRHFIDGVPVSQSVFGRDPFEPVRSSSICEVIAEQVEVPVKSVAETEPVPKDFEGIVVYDAATDVAIDARIEGLACAGELGMVAGCAGLAASLARRGTRNSQSPVPFAEGDLLVVCGSVNDVSRAQIAFAASRGSRVVRIGETEKTDDAWLSSAEGRAFVEELSAAWGALPLTVVDGSGLEDLTGLVAAGADVRQVVADHIGAILSAVCAVGIKGRALVTGGDVLSSFLFQARIRSVEPLGEARPGVVAFRAPLESGELVIASKSGGFGTEDLLVDLANQDTK